MFGTIILDKYRTGEREFIAESLDELCNPCDSYGWASAGIYSFWNYSSKEILYIGLAIDLEERFRQHNGLTPIDPASCKIQQIEHYFQQHEHLGYAVFVQSPLSQPINSKNKATHRKNPAAFGIMDATTEMVKEDIRRVEGILLEAYRQKHGDLPPWNKVHGSIKGQKSTTPGNYEIIKSFSIDTDSLLTSRYTLRELAESPTFEHFESFMHGIRMLMLIFGMTFGEASTLIRKQDILGTFERLEQVSYFQRKLNL